MPRVAVLADGKTEVVDRPRQPLLGSQIRVRVSRAGVNFWEVMQRHGRVPVPADGVLGTEGVGTVVETDDSVTRLSTGTRVAWFKVPGSYAEEVTGDEAQFFPVPAQVTDTTAAGLLFQGVTAQYLATSAWPLPPGSAAVVTAAAGGVGQLLTQLLVDRGVTVIGVVSTPDKHEAARTAGATQVLQYGENLVDQVRSASPGGVHAVYDAVGGPGARDLLGAMRTRGAMVLYGAASGAEAPISAADLVRGSFVLTRTAGRDFQQDPQEIAERVDQLLGLAGEGRIAVQEGGVWPLDSATAALEALESRATTGKLYVLP